MTKPKRQRTRSDLPRAAEPKLTAKTAADFAQLLHCGIPAQEALQRLDDTYWQACDEPARVEWERKWMRSRPVIAAQRSLHGGDWENLDADERLSLAIKKHFAELAYFLIRNNFAALEGAELAKANIARTSILEMLKAKTDEEKETAFGAMMRAFLDEGGALGERPTLGQALLMKALPLLRTDDVEGG